MSEGTQARRKIIPASETDAAVEAASALDEARRVLEEARHSAKAMAEAAKREGYEAGYREGLADMVRSVEAAMADIRASHALDEAEIVEIVLSALERIVGNIEPAERVRQVVNRALADVSTSVRIKIRTAPEDTDYVRQAVMKAGNPAALRLDGVEADSLLSRGEIVLETSRGRQHIGVAQQLARLSAGLRQAHGGRRD